MTRFAPPMAFSILLITLHLCVQSGAVPQTGVSPLPVSIKSTALSDDFAFGGLNPDKWTPNYGGWDFQRTSGVTNPVWFDPNNPRILQTASGINNGLALMLTKKPGTTQEPSTVAYTSGAITSKGTFTHGVLQFEAQFPKGPNTWSAAWLRDANGEYDVECFGNDKVQFTVHWTDPKTGAYLQDFTVATITNANQPHTYVIVCLPDKAQFLVNGSVKKTITNRAELMTKPCRVRFNLSVCNPKPPAVWTAPPGDVMMVIRSCQVFVSD